VAAPTPSPRLSFDLGVNGANVENLTLTGVNGVEGHGNALNNTITATAGPTC